MPEQYMYQMYASYLNSHIYSEEPVFTNVHTFSGTCTSGSGFVLKRDGGCKELTRSLEGVNHQTHCMKPYLSVDL